MKTQAMEETLTQDRLKEACKKAQEALLSYQNQKEGFWSFPVEADTTLTSEYLVTSCFLDAWDAEIAKKARRYLESKQNADGGWSIYFGSKSEVSASVKAYFALKLCGVSPAEPRMVQAKETILKLGGVEACNVFTKYLLALFGEFPWAGTPTMPLEIFIFPSWFYFNLCKVSYWSRTVISPLLVLLHFKPQKHLPPEWHLDELYCDVKMKTSFRMKISAPYFSWKNLFLLIDKGLKVYEKWFWKPWRKKILQKLEKWILDRTDKGGGLGAIFPAMLNTVVALRLLGYEQTHPKVISEWDELAKLIIEEETQLFFQPCVSPVWDTAIAILALAESGLPSDDPRLVLAAEWLLSKQSLIESDWQIKSPQTLPGGWYFQFHNDYYPDVDDTGMVILALQKVKLAPDSEQKKQEAISKGLDWLKGLQSSNGGWGAFDKDNCHEKLNYIPFADHGALLDPSTVDVTARALSAMKGCSEYSEAIEKGIQFIFRNQEKEGCWFGRWGVNYIYGTWAVLSAFSLLKFSLGHSSIKKAITWLESVQNTDGGWGESHLSYFEPAEKGKGTSTASQTSWALLGLFASGVTLENKSVQKGIQYLLKNQLPSGRWHENEFTGAGLPKVFCLRYDGYNIYFPLLALSQATKLDRPCL